MNVEEYPDNLNELRNVGLGDTVNITASVSDAGTEVPTPSTFEKDLAEAMIKDMLATTEEGKVIGEAPYKFESTRWENVKNLISRNFTVKDVWKIRSRFGRTAEQSHTPGKKFTIGTTEYVVGFDGAWRKVSA